MSQLSEALAYASALQAVVYCLFLSARPGGRGREHQLLIVLLAVFAIEKSDQIFQMSGAVIDHPRWAMIGNLFGALIAPLIYFYVRTRIEPSFRIGMRHAWAFAPFILLIIYAVGTFHILSFDQKRAMFEDRLILTPMNVLALPILGSLVNFGFFVASILALRAHDRSLMAWFSDIENRSMAGIRQALTVMAAFLIIHIVWTLTQADGAGVLLNACHFLLINALAISAIRSEGQNREKADYPAAAAQDRKASGDPQLFERADQALRDQQLYLDPNLTVAKLARAINARPRDVSAAINGQAGRNFFEHINRYRIDAAKAALASSDKTVLDIAFAAGFNSKSAFNAAFRRFAADTPSAYRRQARADSR